MKVGYAFVVADLLHIGHLKFLQKCKKYCDFLIVGVYTDQLAASYKHAPIIPFTERMELVRALKPVDMVVKVENKDCTPMLKKLRAEGWDVVFLFHGDDWPEIPGSDYMKSVGGKVIRTPYYHVQSTTKIIETITDRVRRMMS